jgi:hypothetical protein
MKKIQKMEDEEASSHIEVVGKEIRSLFEFQAPKKVKKTVAKKPVKKAAAKAKPKKPVAKPKVKKTVAKKPAAKRPAPKKK